MKTMKNMKFLKVFPYTFIFILLLIIPLQANAEDKLTIYAVNYPLAFFAEQIGGEDVDVVLPVPPGVDPAFWEPAIATIRLV